MVKTEAFERLEEALHDIATKTLEKVVEEHDFNPDIEEVVNNYDFDTALSDAADNYDFDKHIEKAIDYYDFDFSHEAEKAVDEAVNDIDIEGKVEKAADEIVPDRVDAVLPDALKKMFKEFLRDPEIRAMLVEALFDEPLPGAVV